METKTTLAIIAGVIILALLLVVVIFGWYQKGIPVLEMVIDYVKRSFERSTWLTGDPSKWPEWAL